MPEAPNPKERVHPWKKSDGAAEKKSEERGAKSDREGEVTPAIHALRSTLHTPRSSSLLALRSSLFASSSPYIELHVTTNFTFLTGASHPDEMVQQAAALGYPAVAIADRNTLAGIVRAHVAAKEAGVRLVVGCRIEVSGFEFRVSSSEDSVPPYHPTHGELVEEPPTPSLQLETRNPKPETTSILTYPTTRAAYARLCQLLTLGKRRAPKGQCHLVLHDLLERHEGLLAVVVPPADDPWSETPRGLDQDFIDLLAGLKVVFDDDRLSLASACLYGPDDRGRLNQLAALAEHVGVPLVATNDVHYHVPQRRALQDVLTCIRHGCTLDEAGFRLFPHGERHLKPPHDMARLFAAHPQALARSVAIAERAGRFSLDELKYEYPDEICPPGRTAMEYLAELTWKGAAERGGAEKSEERGEKSEARGARSAERGKKEEGSGEIEEVERPEPRPAFLSGVASPSSPSLFALRSSLFSSPSSSSLLTQLTHELALIAELNYAPYFLTVYDLVVFARSQGILCQGRGAAANSAVCYCLGITAVDPRRIDLLFERFISRERNEPPDIDIDFEHERREEVIQYLYQKYGRDRAALTAEVISYRGRSAVRDVGKALGLSLDCVDRLAKSLDWWERGQIQPQRLRDLGLDPDDPTLRLLAELVGEILGFPRHLSQHVGGFVITRRPLSELVPIENAAMEDRTVIEWDKDDIDAMGMLKIDVLGLGMLTAIRKAFDLVNAGATPRDCRAKPRDCNPWALPLALHTVPPEDPAVYDMLCAADSVGVFQVESRAQMSMLPRLRPRCYYDLVIEVAIVRPGPIQGDMVHPYLRRRNGEEAVTYPDAKVRKVLGKTLGVPLFQEQAMALAIVAAGFTPGEADQLRRAIAAWKSKQKVIYRFGEKLIAGMLERGYPREFAERCFAQIQGFSEYGFPESHAASFALLVYVSAWLKKHHPAAFCAALLNSQPMGFYAPAQLVRDAQQHGVEVRAVDVNRSAWDCTLEAEEKSEERGAKSDRKTGATGTNPLAPRSTLHAPRSSALCLRLGLRLVKGLRQTEADAIAAAVARHGPFGTVEELWRASGVRVVCLRRLAAADAFGSMGLDRQQALWQVRGLREGEWPLLENGGAEHGPVGPSLNVAAEIPRAFPGALHAPRATPHVPLPPISLPQHVVHDYATVGLSLKAHPLSFIRVKLAALHVTPAGDLKDETRWPHGAAIAVAGLVLVRQRPGTAAGIVFMTLEDETGSANLIIRPALYTRYRKVARHATSLIARGQVERQGQVVHVLVRRLDDLTEELRGLTATSRDFH